MKLFRTCITLLLMAALLVGCGGSLVYNRLDWLIPWYVEGYVDLSREQRKSLREQLAPLLQRHRQEELARYQQMLEQVEAELANPVTTQQVEGWVEELFRASQRIEQTMLKLSLDFGATLSDAQINEFVDSLYERQEEFEEEFLSRSDDEYVLENAENLEKMLARLLGKLNSQQKQQLQQGASEMHRFDATWLSDRRQWLDQLSDLLSRREGWQEQVSQAYRDREKHQEAEYGEIVAHNTRVLARAIADVLNSRTEKQKKHTTREFKEMQKMLQALQESNR